MNRSVLRISVYPSSFTGNTIELHCPLFQQTMFLNSQSIVGWVIIPLLCLRFIPNCLCSNYSSISVAFLLIHQQFFIFSISIDQIGISCGHREAPAGRSDVFGGEGGAAKLSNGGCEIHLRTGREIDAGVPGCPMIIFFFCQLNVCFFDFKDKPSPPVLDRFAGALNGGRLFRVAMEEDSRWSLGWLTLQKIII